MRGFLFYGSAVLVGSFFGLLLTASMARQDKVHISPETREYRYDNGSHADDHRNLQWRMEQIEAKIDTLQRSPSR